jgi:hypothetical protein
LTSVSKVTIIYTMTRHLYIVWPNDQSVTIYLEDNPAADYYYACMKQLQHVPLSFNQRSNSLLRPNIGKLITELNELSIKLGINLDTDKVTTQDYLNLLHDMYFQNAKKKTFDTQWLRFHDIIHLIEECIGSNARHTQIWFDYQEKAGTFVKSFDREWLKYSMTKFEPGDCVLQPHELGKNLLLYKSTNEALESRQINQLAKPWHTLRPILDIELVEKNKYQQFIENEQTDFLSWFEPYRDSWCKHWQILDWQPREMFAKIPLGRVDDLTTLTQNFSQGYYPKYIKQ